MPGKVVRRSKMKAQLSKQKEFAKNHRECCESIAEAGCD